MDMEITFPGGKRVDASYKGFIIKTDQSKKAGGEGSAPAPFDLFLASLGTCAGFYVSTFCQQRNLPADKAKIILSAERDKSKGMISKITLSIQLPGTFPEKYKKAIQSAADLCSVKKHILNPPEFDIQVNIEK